MNENVINIHLMLHCDIPQMLQLVFTYRTITLAIIYSILWKSVGKKTYHYEIQSILTSKQCTQYFLTVDNELVLSARMCDKCAKIRATDIAPQVPSNKINMYLCEVASLLLSLSLSPSIYRSTHMWISR